MSQDHSQGVVWMDGKLVPWDDAKIHAMTHTFHYGAGCFEGVRAYETDKGPAIFRLKDHTERLFRSAHILRMDVDYSVDDLMQAQVDVIRENGRPSAYLRPVVYYGSESLGLGTKALKTHVMISSWKWGAYMGDGGLKNGVRTMVSSFSRHHVNSVMCKAKANGNYINSIVARKDAESAGYDEAILLDTNGYVAEGTGENIFLLKRGVIYTPELTSVLEGITRETIMTIAGEQGYEVREARITRDELYTADEVFFTGTAAEVTPVVEVDNRAVGTGKPGPVTQKLQGMYFDYVQGKRDDHQEWLTYVE